MLSNREIRSSYAFERKGRLTSRVALIIPSLLPWAGAERVTATIGEELLQRGYKVDLVLVNEPGDLSKGVSRDIRVFNLGVKRFRSLVIPLAGYLRKQNPDAVIVSMWPLTSLSILVHKLTRSRAKLIVCDHNTLSIQYGRRNLAYRATLRTSIRLTYPMADARVTVSNGVADDIAALSGIPRSRFNVIFNPIGPPSAASSPDNGADTLWGQSNAKRILTVGRFKAQKNHRLLIHAFGKLIESIDARLMILGTGELMEETKKFAQAEGLSDRILIPGQVDDTTPYYRSADLFVLSSDYEGFGNVLVEALACGLPVVSTDCRSGPAEILENGRYGILVPVGDADALARGMAAAFAACHDRKALMQRAAEFAPSTAVEKYIQLLFPGKSGVS